MNVFPAARGSVPAVLLLAALLGACGGGGGGGGGGDGSPGQDPPSESVKFTGFTFRVGSGAPTSEAPQENLSAVPPTLGAPLDVTVIFNFDGTPQAPFNQQNLPVYTTPAEVTPEANASQGSPTIPAKGSYVLVGLTVEFRPFVPTEPLQVDLSAPAAAVPGFLPASTYTAKVISTAGLKIPNLKGAGGQVKFDTTSIEGGYFTGGADDGLGPQVVATDPAEGAVDVSPGPYSNFAPGSALPSFPPGEAQFTITYDRAISPTAENLEGKDWDGDGLLEPTYFVRAQATRLLVAQEVPAGSSIGNVEAFPAISGLTDGAAVPPDGAAIFLHDSQGAGALPGADPALSATPSSLAVARDPALLFVILRVDGGNDLLTVADHVLGDPSFADLAAAALDTGLDDVVGLTTLPSGRLLAWDRGARLIRELLPVVERTRPTGEPVLSGLSLGDGTTGFLGEVFPQGIEVLDLATSPDGTLWALVDAGGAFPALQRLTPIDPDLNGIFAAGEGQPDGVPALQLADDYAAISFLEDGLFLALNRGTDAIDRLDFEQGLLGTAVSGVAAYGVPLAGLPGGSSPALDLEVGAMELDVEVEVLSNAAEGAIVRLDPVGVLPIGQRIDVMQRNTLASSSGVSAANEDPDAPLPVLGAQRVLTAFTADPLNTAGPCGLPDADGRVHDVLEEEFLDDALEDPTPTGISPLAEWGNTVAGSGGVGKLRPSIGLDSEAYLGDFLPQPNGNFNLALAYVPKDPIDEKPNPSANWRFVFLDTDAQNFPLANGETPGVTQNVTIFGGAFVFRDFIIPEGVWVYIKGSNPARITVTGRVQIDGVLDVSGSDGFEDITFNTGEIPVPGGNGGPGGGRGGDGHPTVFPPNPPYQHCSGNIFFAAYATPETGERGFGPVVTSLGTVVMQQVGGFGGICTLGYDPDELGYPDVNDQGTNTEHHRPPGGGGGTMAQRGIPAHEGTGSYRVQSTSSWGNFTLCPTNDKQHDALYGTEELQWCCAQAPQPLQCVYLQGTLADPERFQPGALGGDLVFKDEDPSNDHFGGDGELQVLLGGQGGGGGGSRVDSMKHEVWAADALGNPANLPPPAGTAPPCYPNLFIGFYVAPALYDAKGGGGGGGGGALLLRCFGDIVISRTGHIDASGGTGGGGEIVGNSNYSGAGGGGSGGAVILQAAGEIILEADANHTQAGYIDPSGAHGASINVSGGFGFDARTVGPVVTSKQLLTNEFTRSDGGNGGFGLVQLQEGSGDGMPTIQQGAFVFARQRAIIKRYKPAAPDTIAAQNEHPFVTNVPPELRYIDMLYYRSFVYSQTGTLKEKYYVLNGSDPPVIQVTDPGLSFPYQLDTRMMDYFGARVVREPEPHKILATYNGWDALFKEIGAAGQLPGTPHLATDDIPLSIHLNEPDGTPLMEVVDGVERFRADNIIDRLPLVHPSKTPPEFGTVSRGTSRWVDFNGVALRLRDAAGLAPPLFPDGVNGTYNAKVGVPAGKDGQVVLGAEVPGDAPAKFLANIPPLAAPLCDNAAGGLPDPPFNDIKVDSPEFSLENVLTNNATVALLFQGAFPVRSGSSVPDPDTLTQWVSDLRELSGYPLVRFQVVFDLGAEPEIYPFGPDSLRPAVDRVRLRTEY